MTKIYEFFFPNLVINYIIKRFASIIIQLSAIVEVKYHLYQYDIKISSMMYCFITKSSESLAQIYKKKSVVFETFAKEHLIIRFDIIL